MEDSAPSSIHRHRVPGFQASPHQDRLRECRIRDGSDGEAAFGNRQPGSPGSQARRTLRDGRPLAAATLRWRAATSFGRPSIREPAAHCPRRRTNRELGPGDVRGNHAHPRSNQPHRDDCCDGDSRPRHRRRDASQGGSTRTWTRDSRREQGRLRDTPPRG